MDLIELVAVMRARRAELPAVEVKVGSRGVAVHELPASSMPCVAKRTGRAHIRLADGDYALSRVEMDAFGAKRSRPRPPGL